MYVVFFSFTIYIFKGFIDNDFNKSKKKKSNTYSILTSIVTT